MELYQKTIHEINDLLDQKEVTVTEVTQAVVNRINAVEKATDAYLSLQTEAALEAAQGLDAELSGRAPSTPLEGFPYGLKDKLCT